MKIRPPKPRPYTQTSRAEATEATGQRIVDAFLARMLTDWFDEITLDAVAADANVTVQTIIRRFGGKDGLFAAAIPVFAAQVTARRGMLQPASPNAFIQRVLEDYEVTGDAVIRLLALEPRFPILQEQLAFGRAEHRRWVAEAFSPALTTRSPAARDRTLDALVIATDVYTWKLLRRDMGHPLDRTAATMQSLVAGILAGAV